MRKKKKKEINCVNDIFFFLKNANLGNNADKSTL